MTFETTYAHSPQDSSEADIGAPTQARKGWHVSLPESIAPYVHAAVAQMATWGITLYGVINLNKIAVLAGIVLTCMQIYVLYRREFRKKKN